MYRAIRDEFMGEAIEDVRIPKNELGQIRTLVEVLVHEIYLDIAHFVRRHKKVGSTTKIHGYCTGKFSVVSFICLQRQIY